MNETSIYAKTNYSISVSLRAFLCYALLNWFVFHLNEEFINNNNIINCINLVEYLFEDALNKQTIKHWSLTNEIYKLETKIACIKCKLQMYYTNKKLLLINIKD